MRTGMKVALVVAALAIVFVGLTTVKIRKVHAQVTSITLLWTAPGDDGNVGTATSYEIRWSATRPDTTGMTAWLSAGGQDATTPPGLATWWSGATKVAGPSPHVAGTPESFAVPGPFTSGGTYWFELRTCDEAGNCSRSNLTAKFLPDSIAPRAIIDLRAG